MKLKIIKPENDEQFLLGQSIRAECSLELEGEDLSDYNIKWHILYQNSLEPTSSPEENLINLAKAASLDDLYGSKVLVPTNSLTSGEYILRAECYKRVREGSANEVMDILEDMESVVASDSRLVRIVNEESTLH